MAVISGGSVISGGVVMPVTRPRTLYGHGVPDDETTYAGMIAVGDFYADVDTGHLYEYTEPATVPTFTRIDTVN